MGGRTPDLVGKRTLSDVIADIKKPNPGVDTAWYKVGPTLGVNFTNSATNWTGGDGDPPVGWYLSEDGEVRLRGAVQAAVGVMFRLPEEVRPEFSQTFICPTEANDSEEEAHIHLNGIKFRAFEESDIE